MVSRLTTVRIFKTISGCVLPRFRRLLHASSHTPWLSLVSNLETVGVGVTPVHATWSLLKVWSEMDGGVTPGVALLNRTDLISFFPADPVVCSKQRRGLLVDHLCSRPVNIHWDLRYERSPTPCLKSSIAQITGPKTKRLAGYFVHA